MSVAKFLTVKLSRGQVAIIDPDDASLILPHRWTFLNAGRGYAMRSYTQDGKKIYQLMHRLIVAAPFELEVDHKNGDSLDNRRVNLRICTHKNNRGNTRKHKDNTSGFKGVSWHKGAQKWSAQVKSIYLGLFDNCLAAARAYDEAAKQVFGPYANLNFPENP